MLSISPATCYLFPHKCIKKLYIYFMAAYDIVELYPILHNYGHSCRKFVKKTRFSGTAVSILRIKETQLIKSSEHHSWRGLVNAKVAAMVDVVASCHNSGV